VAAEGSTYIRNRKYLRKFEHKDYPMDEPWVAHEDERQEKATLHSPSKPGEPHEVQCPTTVPASESPTLASDLVPVAPEANITRRRRTKTRPTRFRDYVLLH
jgi:hypothetical protein